MMTIYYTWLREDDGDRMFMFFLLAELNSIVLQIVAAQKKSGIVSANVPLELLFVP